jgi:DNA polymerase III epsilon subunit-like protein
VGLATIILDNLSLLSLDLETTGLRPKTDRIVQIGADQKSGTANKGLFI